MKIMFFCWAEEIRNEFIHVTKYLAQLQQDFILTPIIRFKDKIQYDNILAQLSEVSKNVIVAPIYIKSPNSNFSNFLLNPCILLEDFSSIHRTIKLAKPDIIVCFYISHAYPLAFLKRISKFSLCTVAMGSDVNIENSFLQKKMRKFVYRNCDLIFARSWNLKDKIEKEYECNVIVNPSSADTAFFRPLEYKSKLREKWNIDAGKSVILTVCRLDKNKGVEVLLKSLQALGDYDLKVLIVGDGTERKSLEELTYSLGLKEKVAFMGLRSKLELLELYNLSDVFTLTSYSEGLPRVLIEAMACGCIPIVTDVGNISTLTINGYNGFTLAPGDHSRLSEKIRETLTMPKEEQKRIQIRARQSVVESFDSKKVWENMVETIRAAAIVPSITS